MLKSFKGCGLCPWSDECFTGFSTPILLILATVLMVGIHTLTVAFPVSRETFSRVSKIISGKQLQHGFLDKSLLK